MPGRMAPCAPEKRTRLASSQKPVVAKADNLSADEVVGMLLFDEVLEDKKVDFLLAYYEQQGTLHRACAKALVPFKIGKQWRDEDPRMGQLCAQIDEILVEALHKSYWDRAMDPEQRQPAYQIFALKSRDVRYSERPMERVAIQVNVTDGGKGGAVVSLAPALATPVPKALIA